MMVKHQKVEGHMETEAIVVAIKKLILPELEAIKGIQAKMDVKLDAVEKRISDLQVHLVEQSRRIDETNSRIDHLRLELTGRIDETNRRIDQLTFQVGKLAQEVERIKREEAVTGDILTRLRSLETKTA